MRKAGGLYIFSGVIILIGAIIIMILALIAKETSYFINFGVYFVMATIQISVGVALKNMNDTVKFQKTRLVKLANQYNLQYVDIFSSLYNEATGAMYDEYTTDMVHFTDQGYQVISSLVRPAIKKAIG